jgi:hypothetical protein
MLITLLRDLKVPYIDKLQVMKKVRSYEKRHEVTIKVRCYEKVRSYEKGKKLRNMYEVTERYKVNKKGTKLRNKLRKALVTKLPSYQIVTPPIGIIYYDVYRCIREKCLERHRVT